MTGLLFYLLETLSGFFVKTLPLQDSQFAAERIHTEYDPVLGWINKPNFTVEDMYGRGKGFRTNAQRFRGTRDYDSNAIKGKRRFICSGDSFTLGYGVGDDDTWCALLEAQMPNVETINMGQGGYGIDQAYLWYMRDGAQLEHDILIFAFNTIGFGRMARDRFLKYPKPLLDVSEGRVIHRNFPVPKPNLLFRFLPRYEPILSNLNVVRLIQKIKNWIGSRQVLKSKDRSKAELKHLTSAIFQSLIRQTQQSGSTVQFVYLPLMSDCRQDASNTKYWRNFLQLNAREAGVELC